MYMKKTSYKNKKFLARLCFALNGISSAFQNEASFRFQIIVALIVLIILAITKTSLFWWLFFILIIAAILSAELFNTSLENALDKLCPTQHPQIKVAKDCAAAAVLILSFVSILFFLAFIAVEILNLTTIL